jgi:hypothetical protein
VQIGAADGDGVHLDDRIARIGDHRIRYVRPRLLAGATEDQAPYCYLPAGRRRGSRVSAERSTVATLWSSRHAAARVAKSGNARSANARQNVGHARERNNFSISAMLAV